ncbi:scarecrow-like transcription factor PAT1 [Prosopis cineraria]|uniref:scarecrow-like transcription factor PAT1 n=1 Tax=Prosopis cineraria TaxID=364024 RepID=UPI00240F603B|nr:scarecrow-like transcription factor PAT1 [Prosopis cineraria]
MQTSQKHEIFYGSVQTLESYNSSIIQTLESSCSTSNSNPGLSSPSANGSAESESGMLKPQYSLESCLTLTPDLNDLSQKLRELETAMLGPDADISATYDSDDTAMYEAEKWKKTIEMISRGDMKEMLCACAYAMVENDMETSEWLMSELREMVSVSGNPLQRLGAYLLEALVARLSSSGSKICKSLKCNEPTSSELLSYMNTLYEICPYFKFGYLSATGAIADAMKRENRVHIIDFQINQGIQWVSLIQALAFRPGGPPEIRITGVDDSISAFTRGGGLEIVGKRLSALAQSCNVPFQFHAVEVSSSDVHLQHLELLPGEGIAVNFTMMLHHLQDQTIERLLRLVSCLRPKVVTLVEQESETNHVPFFPRFVQTMNYYLPVFESIDDVMPRDNRYRINVEQHCLAREIVNLIACEGEDRVERHETLETWKSRFRMAGFSPYPLSSFINFTIKNLLEGYSRNYTLQEKDGALYLGWMNQPLVASCAWR